MQLINKIVEPTSEEIAIGQQRAADEEQRKKHRADVRRERMKAKAAYVPTTSLDAEDSDVDEVDNSFDSPTMKMPSGEELVNVGEPPIVLSGSRESMNRQLFGEVSTSSSGQELPTVTYQLKVTTVAIISCISS